nr:MAG TPA: hypothetical protein [Caudoviricetes sp.]
MFFGHPIFHHLISMYKRYQNTPHNCERRSRYIP